MSTTPNYRLTRPVGELPEGAFIRPIKLKYLPKDWADYVKGAEWFKPESETVCYTRLGLCIIPNDAFRRV